MFVVLKRVLKGVEQIPIYALFAAGEMTLHWYTRLGVRHFSPRGHAAGVVQLQVRVDVGVLGLLSFLLFEEEMFCARLGVVE